MHERFSSLFQRQIFNEKSLAHPKHCQKRDFKATDLGIPAFPATSDILFQAKKRFKVMEETYAGHCYT